MLYLAKDFGLDEVAFAEVERLVSLGDADVGTPGKKFAWFGHLAFDKLFRPGLTIDREDARAFATAMFTRVLELKLQVSDFAEMMGQADAALRMVLDRESATMVRHDARLDAVIAEKFECFCGGSLTGFGSIHSAGGCSTNPEANALDVEESEESWQAAEAMLRPSDGERA